MVVRTQSARRRLAACPSPLSCRSTRGRSGRGAEEVEQHRGPHREGERQVLPPRKLTALHDEPPCSPSSQLGNRACQLAQLSCPVWLGKALSPVTRADEFRRCAESRGAAGVSITGDCCSGATRRPPRKVTRSGRCSCRNAPTWNRTENPCSVREISVEREPDRAPWVADAL